MGKTTDFLKKAGETKGMFHAKMGTIKERNSRDLTEAEESKRKWREYTEELCIKNKKGLNDPSIHNDVNTHLEPDKPDCDVKWGLGSFTRNKASGG